jgi:uncharacterized protein involved in type VI secretion and phage assembly
MEDAVHQLVRDAQQRFYGKYRGFVADNADRERRGRLKLRVPSVLGDQLTGWALPCLPFGGKTNQGLFMIPENDSQVWVEFEEGNVDKPVWVGVFWQQESDTPEEATLDIPTTRSIHTPSGHVLQFDDAGGEERFRLAHPVGTEMTIDPNGTVELTDAVGNALTLDAENKKIVVEDSNGNTLTMDAKGTVIEDSNGNKIEMVGAGITVKGTTIKLTGNTVDVAGPGGEALIKAQTFMAMYNSHTHVCTAPGSPSAPPVPPLTPAALTTKTKAV